MTDIAVRPTRVAFPVTGEVLKLDSPTDALADALAKLREIDYQSRAAKAEITAELLSRFDKEAQWTIRVNGYELKADGPGRVEYDAPALYRELNALVNEGLFSEEALNNAVEAQTTFKAKAAGINKLKKLGGEVEAAIERCSSPSAAPRRVSVKELAA